MVISADHATDRSDRECASQVRRVADITFVVISPRTLMVRRHTNVYIRAHGKLLRAAEPERHLGIENQRVVREKLVTEPIVKGQAIEIVFAAQNQVVKLRHEIIEPRLHVETAEVKTLIVAVVKNLLPRTDGPVERVGKARLIIRRD